MFGGCFGHQIIAKALGGIVETLPSPIYNISAHTITEPKIWSELGGVNKEVIYIHKTHGYVVTKLPKEAINLLSTEENKFDSFYIPK